MKVRCTRCNELLSKSRMVQHSRTCHAVKLERLVNKINFLFAHDELTFYRRIQKRRPAGIQ